MNKFFQIDWNSVFVPTVSIPEIILRGTVMYLMLFAVLRILRREAGGLGIADVLVIVLIADAAQNAMSSTYKSVTEGVVLVGTIVFWDVALDWLAFRFPGFQRLIRPAPLLLIKDGRMQRKHMRQEMISEDELMSQLRQQGVENVTEVKKACLEGDGRVSVITKKKSDSARNQSPEKKF
ncbi:MAG: YetF domain-containing protein [bacterium]